MTLYRHTFLKKLNEDMTAGSGGVLGSWNSGEYADGDARIPHALGAKKPTTNARKRREEKLIRREQKLIRKKLI